MAVRDECPACESQQYKKNGHIHNGKQNHHCKDCGRQFVLHAENRVIDAGQRNLVERLLLTTWQVDSRGAISGVKPHTSPRKMRSPPRMLPIGSVPATIATGMQNSRDVFCRAAGFAQVSR
jgi:hypothetical protein